MTRSYGPANWALTRVSELCEALKIFSLAVFQTKPIGNICILSVAFLVFKLNTFSRFCIRRNYVLTGSVAVFEWGNGLSWFNLNFDFWKCKPPDYILLWIGHTFPPAFQTVHYFSTTSAYMDSRGRRLSRQWKQNMFQQPMPRSWCDVLLLPYSHVFFITGDVTQFPVQPPPFQLLHRSKFEYRICLRSEDNRLVAHSGQNNKYFATIPVSNNSLVINHSVVV